ncbi:MAG: KamA family radical SAM protein [Kiritimatiellae bacterium]|nr:KamA family radical SAM protein [Kiritimatiellia bacterium]
MSRSEHTPHGRQHPRWHDWRWQMRHEVTGRHPALSAFGVTEEVIARVHSRYPVCVSPYALSLLDPSNPGDPLNLQALPSARELRDEPGAADDPFGERRGTACCRGLIRRFPDRVLVMAHDRCAMACRHCTRKNLLPDAEVIRTTAQLAAAADWVRARPEVREVLISGGDPLLLSDRRVTAFVKAFADLPQIDAVRVGTRVPVTLPMRVTPALAASLGKFRKVWVNTQFNHAREITPEAAAACALLVEAGIPLSNQSVLLKNVNDSADALFELCAGLQRIRVRPYYIFMCDPVKGTAHFRVPLVKARRLERELAARVGGLALPRFVIDRPGAYRKVPIGESLRSGSAPCRSR